MSQKTHPLKLTPIELKNLKRIQKDYTRVDTLLRNIHTYTHLDYGIDMIITITLF